VKQVLQYADTGEIAVADVPEPRLLPGCVLVRVAASLVSAGTERASAEFARKSLFQKARARPDLVREVVGRVRRDGLFSAMSAVRSRLDTPASLGYSCAGTVIAVAPDINDVRVGDRVACAGAGYAVHAEIACVPRLLLAKIPADSTDFEDAAFTTVGAVALHGIRTADVKLGDTVAVIGLGLLGQLTVQLLKAAGCSVLGMDILPQRAELGLQLGADGSSLSDSDFASLCSEQTHGDGVDAVLITAETSSSRPVNLAAEIARDRAVIVAVGAVGMDIERKLYYEKELDFRISRSYGPGRYDSAYEQQGRDYPIGYVRWTETRNMEAFLHLLKEGKINVKPLITHRFPIHRATGAYRLLSGESGVTSLGIVITYDEAAERIQRLELVPRENAPARKEESVKVGLLGAGSFAIGTLLPAMKKIAGINLVGACAANGLHSRHTADKFGFRYCASDDDKIIDDSNINTIVIATRHNLHASQVISSITAGKNVFCEKPLCLTEEELFGIARVYVRSLQKQLLMVGFNRRFAPMALRMKAFVDQIREPLALHYRVNAGYIPRDHWVNDPRQGGGRILGEVCHFIDFLAFLAGSAPVEVFTRALPNSGEYSDDNVVISLQFANGSQGTISYLANGDRKYSKERVEVFGGKSAAVLEDFRLLELVRHGKKQFIRSRFRQDKGHHGEWQAFVKALLAGGQSPIPFHEIVTTTVATLAAASSRSSGKAVSIDGSAFLAAAADRLGRES
jgi:predicted dehydrogenase/threonine dehydrogenase-like Zn-dependent dehydrogenase